MFNRLLTLLFGVALLTVNASAQCPGTADTAKPVSEYDDEDWYYSGTHSTAGFSNAAADWNAVEAKVHIGTGQFEDILISDDDSIAPFLGQQISYAYQPASPCYNFLDECGYCANSSILWYATVQLNQTGIANTAAQWMLSVDVVTEKVMSHEFGHYFRLVEYNGPDNCSFSTIMSSSEPYTCQPQFSGPTYCDVGVFNISYSQINTVPFESCPSCNS